MLGILKLIRIRTLLFAAFTMYCMRYFVIRSILDINGLTLQLPDWAFTLSVLSVCSLIAGANVINDYFDTRIDRLSAVKDVVVGRCITRRTAMTLHSVLNVLAIVIAFGLSIYVGIWKIGILFLLVSGLLWFYSSTYKRYLLVGNLIVGILAALIPLCVLLFEIPLLNNEYSDLLIQTGTNFMYLFNWILGFSLFIFLNTVIYEMNKDIYTIPGDIEKGIRSVPVRWGIQATRIVILVWTAIAVCCAVVLYFTVFSESSLVLTYIVLGICLPYCIYLICVWLSVKRSLQLGIIRLIMVLCVAFSFLLHHFFDLIFAN